ncbi:MAG: porin [Hyphomicrobium sp.]
MRGGNRTLCCAFVMMASVAGVIQGDRALAADLGGDCCSDLEERIAELEATTVRKGNRKVSFSISGFLSQQVMYWDDGNESNVYVNGQAPDLATRFTFAGEAIISPGWKAGYQLTVSLDATDALLVDQNNANVGTGIDLIHSNWYLQSDSLGRLTVGKQSHASDNAALDSDLSGTLIAANTVTFDGASFRLRPKGGLSGASGLSSATWWELAFFCQSTQLGIGGDCAGDRRNAIRYDTPAFGGLVLSASWGEDDFWDVSARWKGEWQDFQLALSGAYTSATDLAFGDATYTQVGGFIKHNPSGLWVHALYGEEGASLPGTQDDSHYYIKAGLTQKWVSLGSTHIYGEYGQNHDMHSAYPAGTASLCADFFGVGGSISNACGGAADTTVSLSGTEATRIGIGLVQDIDTASMQLWAKWRMHQLEATFVDSGVAGKQKFEDFNMGIVGAIIFF